MKDKYLHPIRNGIIATVIGGAILSTLPQLRGFLLDAISWARAGLTWTWATLASYYSMPGWAFLAVGLLGLVGLVAICAGLRPEGKPEYKSYTEDLLYGAKWRWSWTRDTISNLWCFCPRCDAQLVYIYDSLSYEKKTHFMCEQCPPNESDHRYQWQGRVPGQIITTVEGGDKNYVVSRVEREILRRIRVNEYNRSRG